MGSGRVWCTSFCVRAVVPAINLVPRAFSVAWGRGGRRLLFPPRPQASGTRLACYVGETTRRFSTRVREHMFSDRTSHIFKHLQNSDHCRTLCSNDCFSILDHASTTFQLKIKEAIHLQWEQPTLYHQLYHVH